MGGDRGFNPRPYIYYTPSLPTKLSSRRQKAKTYVKTKGVSNPHLLTNPTTLTMNNVNEWCCPNSRTDLERGYPIYSHQSKQQ